MAIRPVMVVLRDNVLNDDGLIVATEGTEGEVIKVSEPPYVQRYMVRFTILGSPVDVWVSAKDIAWRDGLLGPVRAVVILRSTLLVDCEFQSILSKQDLIVDGMVTAGTNAIKFITDDGYAIYVTQNANNDIVAEYRLEA